MTRIASRSEKLASPSATTTTCNALIKGLRKKNGEISIMFTFYSEKSRGQKEELTKTELVPVEKLIGYLTHISRRNNGIELDPHYQRLAFARGKGIYVFKRCRKRWYLTLPN